MTDAFPQRSTGVLLIHISRARSIDERPYRMTSSISSTGTPDFFVAPRAGIKRGFERMNKAAANIANGDVSPENMIGLIEASAQVKASAEVVRVSDDATKSLFDTFA